MNACNTRCSQAVTHLSTNRTRRSLSSEIERDQEHSTWINQACYISTVDEAWVYLDTTNGVRRVYYEIKGARTPESWTKFCKKSDPVGVMFFAGICWRGVITLRFIEPGAKINSDYYIKHCLKPLIEVDIPHLYPGEEHKVVLHQDSAPAHVSKKT
ncbi:hypothetical protein BV898_19954 [Hypsibius exemplaris]|uniref:Uncharacterized protein n=1 Tax=Hypsibius exemplaris TaxID=2072580 RepID=A0A9X6NME8_HYPEX|nr:hypothetical protein BV898_19954 [Hypsibius exemplaris]